MKLLRYLLRNPVSLIGVLILLAFVLVAIFAPVLAPPQEFQMSVYDTPRAGFLATPQPPSAEAIFGTTEGQYDIYYAVIWGTRTAFKIGLGVVAISVLIGTLIGSVAAYYGGAVDEILMRIVDVFMAVPFLIAAMVLTALLGKGIGPITIALTTFGWMGYARVIRSEILRIREMDYVHAARSYGAGDLRLIALHILPNAFFPSLFWPPWRRAQWYFRLQRSVSLVSALRKAMQTGAIHRVFAKLDRGSAGKPFPILVHAGLSRRCNLSLCFVMEPCRRRAARCS